LKRQQREQRVDRRQLTRARIAGSGEQTGQVELEQFGHEQ
jgi:hypothetical protein